MAWNQTLGRNLKESSLDKVQNASILCAKRAGSGCESAFWGRLGTGRFRILASWTVQKYGKGVASWVIVRTEEFTGVQIVLELETMGELMRRDDCPPRFENGCRFYRLAAPMDLFSERSAVHLVDSELLALFSPTILNRVASW